MTNCDHKRWDRARPKDASPIWALAHLQCDAKLRRQGPSCRATRKQGIALVVVLGFLSVLVLMAVAFAIIMRTERLASRNYMNTVRGRQLVHAALAHILANEIRTNMADEVYPTWDAWPVSAGGSGQEFIFSGGSNYVPRSLKPSADQADVSPMNWQPLYDAGDGSFIGKYAYIVVNNSGLLDANYARGTNAYRRYGVDPGEIRVDPAVLPEVANDTLHTYRSAFRRFESVPELWWLCKSGGTDLSIPAAMRGRPYYVDNFHVFSRFPRGFADPDSLLVNTNVAYIGGTPSNWNFTSIQTALADLSGEPTDPIPDLTAFINALYDYADDSSYISRNPALNTFSSKAVPMINEVIVSNQFLLRLEGTNQVLDHFLYLTVETWYPFPNDPDNPRFQVTYAPGVPQVTVLPITFPPLTLVSAPPAVEHDDYDFKTSTFIYNHSAVVNGSGSPAYPPPNLGVRCVLNGILEVQYLGTAVDRVNPGWPVNAFQVVGPPPALVLGSPNPVRFGEPAASSVNDPRINWNPESSATPLQWDRVMATPLAINAPRLSGPADEIGLMYARSLQHTGEGIQSVGEVGFLLYDTAKPWTTVRLLGPDPDGAARILDRLTVHTNGVRQGMVNINTRQTNALAAVFYEMSLTNAPPRMTGSSKLSEVQAKAFAEYVVANNQGWGVGPMLNYSDIPERWDQAEVAAVLGVPGTNKFFIESVVRNSLGLFGTRHNLFTIMLAARVFSDNYDPDDPALNDNDYYLSEQRALAVLWRDPFLSTRRQGARPSHENFIRFFHWLLEDYGE